MKIPLPFIWQTDAPQFVKLRKAMMTAAGLDKNLDKKSWKELTTEEKESLMIEYYSEKELEDAGRMDHLDKTIVRKSKEPSDDDILEELLKDT